MVTETHFHLTFMSMPYNALVARDQEPLWLRVLLARGAQLSKPDSLPGMFGWPPCHNRQTPRSGVRNSRPTLKLRHR
jgi:hypothetical protein